jgi:integrase
MKGNIRKRSENSWQITIDIGRDPKTGKRRQHIETLHSKRAAEKRLAELILSVEGGGYTRPVKITLADWLEKWHRDYVTNRCDQRTAGSYLSEIRSHLIPSLGAIRLDQLSANHIQSYIARALREGRLDGKGGLSVTTVRYHYRILSQSLQDAVGASYIARNVAKMVKPPRSRRTIMKTMALKDVPRFLEASLNTPYYWLYYAALYTGMRLGELCGLPWRAVDLENGYISVFQELFKRGGVCDIKQVKTRQSRRHISMSPSLVRVLRSLRVETEAQAVMLGRTLTGEDLVFAYPDGRPFDPSTVSHAFGRVLRDAGLPSLRFHDLRHSHATFLLAAGVNVKVVSERLGHASVAFTLDTYGHVMPGMQESAAESLDRLLLPALLEPGDDVRMLSDGCQDVVNGGEVECEPRRTRTSNRLIKSQLLCQLS